MLSAREARAAALVRDFPAKELGGASRSLPEDRRLFQKSCSKSKT
jgi:hypothetical protein